MLTRRYLLKTMKFEQSYGDRSSRTTSEYRLTKRVEPIAAADWLCPRHRFAKHACPGCASDAAMLASVEVHR